MKADSGMTTELETPVGSDVDVAWLRLGGPEGEDTRDDIPSPQIASQRRKRQPRPKVDIAPRRLFDVTRPCRLWNTLDRGQLVKTMSPARNPVDIGKGRQA